MKKLKKLSGHEMIKALSLFGFEPIRQTGSHIILKKKTHDGSVGCVVPAHKELKIGTIKSILKLAKITEKEFLGED